MYSITVLNVFKVLVRKGFKSPPGLIRVSLMTLKENSVAISLTLNHNLTELLSYKSLSSRLMSKLSCLSGYCEVIISLGRRTVFCRQWLSRVAKS